MRTDRFRKDHKELIECVRSINELMKDPSRQGTHLAHMISKMSGTLIIHLTAEDNMLYPTLMKSPDRNISSTAKKFQKEMGGIKEIWSTFVDKYRIPSYIESHFTDFKSEINTIFDALTKRIEQEETILYDMYDKI